MNTQEINALLGVNPIENPFAQQANKPQENTKDNSIMKTFGIDKILNRPDEEEQIEIIGELFDDESFSF